ncbi:hypothetical protein JRQ81_002355 [Phrynocephalus forsythii]|uniref:Uncharacterized protein n=1 Tax=Phrynocephalus forsythii TaxID=171643 RepID=A0A9Q0XJZ5_9SAUR|nr:hypothetical protein JRQ81_002355 [Phrynocephalus forsythii]
MTTTAGSVGAGVASVKALTNIQTSAPHLLLTHYGHKSLSENLEYSCPSETSALSNAALHVTYKACNSVPCYTQSFNTVTMPEFKDKGKNTRHSNQCNLA